MRALTELSDLSGRVALITGGAGGIGSAMCAALAELGANVAVLDINESACHNVADNIRVTYGVEAKPLIVDLADEKQVLAVPERVKTSFGQLDILVNNAALVGTLQLRGWTVPFLQQRADTWRLALEINLTVPFVLTQACAELLMTSGHGSVINVSSIYGMVGPDWNLYEDTHMGNPAAYGASKGGLLQLTRYLATALAPRVRVNAITPGGVLRDQPEVFQKRYVTHTPLGRMGHEEDFKGAVAYLASDLSAYVTGHNLVVDGGWTIW